MQRWEKVVWFGWSCTIGDWFGVAYGLLLTKLRCVSQEVVQKRGLNNITHEDLVREITPKGRSLVPDVVKKELLVKIQTFLSHQQNM